MNVQISKILVPTDFSGQSRRAFEYAIALARKLDASIDLVHVWEPPRYVAPDLMLAVPGWSAVTVEQFSRAEAAKELEAFLAKVDPQGVKVRSGLEVGDAAATICRVSRDSASDLIVMGTHGRSGMARLVLGSVAQKVVTRADCPVLTIRVPEEQRPETE